MTVLIYSNYEQGVSGDIPVDSVLMSGGGGVAWVSRTSAHHDQPVHITQLASVVASGSGAMYQERLDGANQWSYLSGFAELSGLAWTLEADLFIPSSASQDQNNVVVEMGVNRPVDANLNSSGPQLQVQLKPKEQQIEISDTDIIGSLVSASASIPLGRPFKIAFQHDPNNNYFDAFVSTQRVLRYTNATASRVSSDTVSVELRHTVTQGGGQGFIVWDNVRLIVGGLFYNVQDTDSAEFDWEASSPSLSQVLALTTFARDIYAFRCHVINVPACSRRIRAKNACRRMTVDPTVH